METVLPPAKRKKSACSTIEATTTLATAHNNDDDDVKSTLTLNDLTDALLAKILTNLAYVERFRKRKVSQRFRRVMDTQTPPLHSIYFWVDGDRRRRIYDDELAEEEEVVMVDLPPLQMIVQNKKENEVWFKLSAHERSGRNNGGVRNLEDESNRTVATVMSRLPCLRAIRCTDLRVMNGLREDDNDNDDEGRRLVDTGVSPLLLKFLGLALVAAAPMIDFLNVATLNTFQAHCLNDAFCTFANIRTLRIYVHLPIEELVPAIAELRQLENCILFFDSRQRPVQWGQVGYALTNALYNLPKLRSLAIKELTGGLQLTSRLSRIDADVLGQMLFNLSYLRRLVSLDLNFTLLGSTDLTQPDVPQTVEMFQQLMNLESLSGFPAPSRSIWSLLKEAGPFPLRVLDLSRPKIMEHDLAVLIQGCIDVFPRLNTLRLAFDDHFNQGEAASQTRPEEAVRWLWPLHCHPTLAHLHVRTRYCSFKEFKDSEEFVPLLQKQFRRFGDKRRTIAVKRG